MLDRISAPPFSRSFTFELPQPEIFSLGGGVDLFILQGLQQEVFKLEFVFNAGKWWESKSGVSHFTSIMLEKGTRGKSSKEIANLLDYYGAQVEISPGYDYTSVSIYGLKKFFDQTYSLLSEILNEPSFDQNEFDLQKEIFLQNLKVNNEKNSFVASKVIRKNIFGENHPYGNSIEEYDVTSLKRQDLLDFFREAYRACSVFLVGNFTTPQIKSLTEKIVSKSIVNQHPDWKIVPGKLTETIVKQESVQSSIRLGKRIVNRNHPDYFLLLLVNHILGGYFGSRLMKNIREEKGLTYGIYSSMYPFKEDSLFTIGADVGKDKKEVALNEINQEILQLVNHRVPDEELHTAKNHFLGNLQLDVANPFSALDKIKNINLNGLGDDYYKNLFKTIKGITPETIQNTAIKYFNSQDFFEVSVG